MQQSYEVAMSNTWERMKVQRQKHLRMEVKRLMKEDGDYRVSWNQMEEDKSDPR